MEQKNIHINEKKVSFLDLKFSILFASLIIGMTKLCLTVIYACAFKNKYIKFTCDECTIKRVIRINIFVNILKNLIGSLSKVRN